MTTSPSYVLPPIFTLCYMTKQFGTQGSIYSVGADPSVFNYLANTTVSTNPLVQSPPATGVASEDWSNDNNEVLGAAAVTIDASPATLGSQLVNTAGYSTTYQTRLPVANINKDKTRQRDPMVDFYDHAAIYTGPVTH